MKVSFDKKAVLAGIQKAVSIMPPKSGSMSLRTLWICADENGLTISSTDANIEFTGTYPANVVEHGFVGVQGQLFLSLIKNCSDELTLTCGENAQTVTLKHKSGVCKLPIMQQNWYEKNSACPASPVIDWSGDLFKEVIENCGIAASEDEGDVLASLYITNHDKYIRFMGLNGHYFAMYELMHEQMKECLPEEGLLIKKEYLSTISKFIGTAEMQMSFTNKRIFFLREGECLSVPRLADGTYPDVNLFLGRLEESTTLIVNRDDMLSTLTRIKTVNTDTNSTTDFEINVETQKISCNAQDENNGEISEELPMQYSGDLKKISFRTQSLIVLLKHYTSKEIEFHFTDAQGPCGFFGDDDPFYTSVLMPVTLLPENSVEVEYATPEQESSVSPEMSEAPF